MQARMGTSPIPTIAVHFHFLANAQGVDGDTERNQAVFWAMIG